MKMDPLFRKALGQVLTYLHEEREHYGASPDRSHIYKQIALLQAYMDESEFDKIAALRDELLESACGS